MLVQPQQAATVCELDLVRARHQVMETGSDLGSETTAGGLPMNPWNLTLDLEHAHVSSRCAVCENEELVDSLVEVANFLA
jgi:hypothetical protein